MNSRGLCITLLAACLLTISAAVPVASGAASPYLTIGIASSAVKQATVGQVNGVLLNYTSSYSKPIGTFVYMDLANSAGQTVYWNVATCAFAANQKVQCFVPIASSVAKGIYNATVFLTTNSSIPISTTTLLQVTI